MADRFEFGKNWTAFLQHLNEDRISEARKSLVDMLGMESLEGKTFLDIGSGSGLFSLVARQLGAQVHSFDYDKHSVSCTQEMRKRYFPDDAQWTVEQGDILSDDYLKNVSSADIVYSWGVLHHTGDMWTALKNAGTFVKPGGKLFVAIYNDQGYKSKVWRFLKRMYCASTPGRLLVTALGSTYFFLILLKEDLVRLRNPVTRYNEYKKNRGMSMWYDWIDWFGGYPFEVAKPDELFDFYQAKGFSLDRLITVGGNLACFELVFSKTSSSPDNA